jgi:hypothetical protein
VAYSDVEKQRSDSEISSAYATKNNGRGSRLKVVKTNEKLEWRSEHRAASAQALAKNVSSKSFKKDKSKIVSEFLDYVTHD